MSRLSKLSKLWTPVDIAPLVMFRLLFGVIMVYYVFSMWTGGWIEYFYIQPVFNFTYTGFGWVQPWPSEWVHVHFLVMAISAAGIALGLFYRLSAAVFFLTFTHAFLMEKALYQNHYYLICLIGFLMVFLPCHRAFSLDVRWRPLRRSATAPAWTLWILRAQIAIPYFFGGLAKFDSDWLQGMPIRLWLARYAEVPVVGPYFTEDWVVYFFAYGGLLYDLAIVPLLLWPRTRLFAFLVTLGFHLTNAALWHIGIFPWLMIGATLLFFDPGWVRRLLRLPPVSATLQHPARSLAVGQRTTVALLSIYLAWQVLMPFRHLLYPGRSSWTEEGHQFSWHMMLREKNVAIRFYIHDPQRGKKGILQVSSFLNYRQLSRMGRDADMILDFAHFVRDHYREHDREGLQIYVLNLVSLNGRKPQLMLDPLLDCASTERLLVFPQPWILPLEEPLRAEAWSVPVEDWEKVLDLDLPAEIFGKTRPGRLDAAQQSGRDEGAAPE